MKILILSHFFSPDVGGIETNSEILATEFVDLGHEVRLLTWSNRKDAKTFSFQVLRNPGIGQLVANHFWADVVFENNPALRLSWPALLSGRPVVVALNTWVTQADGSVGLQEKLKIKWLQCAAKVIAVSEAVRLKIFPNAIVIANPYQQKLFRKIDLKERRKDFVFLGRLVSDKGCRLAINALMHLIDTMDEVFTDDLCLTIIGDGAEKASLEQTVNDYELQNHIKFTGILQGKKLVEELNTHSFILIPSIWEEPFGNVALEGMACGCIPIAADGGGLPDAVGDGGLLFRRGDVNSLAECMMRVLTEPGLVAELRRSGEKHLLKHQAKPVAQRYLSVFEDAVALKK